MYLHHLEESEVGDGDVVKVHLGIIPGQVLRLAFAARRHQTRIQDGVRGVDASLESPPEQIHSHDAEYEPEDETDEQDVKDGGDGLDEGVDHHLRMHISIFIGKTS